MSRSRRNALSHWPNFIVVGPGKSGTSWLYQVLGAHHQVCMSSAKETLFFETEYHRGLQWYQKFFRSCGIDRCQHAIGEISNTYIFHPAAAERIAHHFPDMKIVVTLRNPVDRAFSHYLFLRRRGEIGGSFEDALKQRPDLLDRGQFSRHLRTFDDFFPREQIQVLLYDDLKTSAPQYAADLFRFLGVGPLHREEVLEQHVLGASRARSVAAAKLGVGVASLIRRCGFPEWVTRVKNSRASQLFFAPIDRQAYPRMDQETRRRLVDHFRDDAEQLNRRLQRPVSSLWYGGQGG